MNLNEILKYWNLEENTLVSAENIEYKTKRDAHIWNVNNKYILKMTNSENQNFRRRKKLYSNRNCND